MYGPKRGFAQSEYFDQQATALAGMLANASDINLTDSAFVVTDEQHRFGVEDEKAHDLCREPVGEHFLGPHVIEPPHRHIIPEPHM